jgi:hypothetical protein
VEIGHHSSKGRVQVKKSRIGKGASVRYRRLCQSALPFALASQVTGRSRSACATIVPHSQVSSAQPHLCPVPRVASGHLEAFSPIILCFGLFCPGMRHAWPCGTLSASGATSEVSCTGRSRLGPSPPRLRTSRPEKRPSFAFRFAQASGANNGARSPCFGTDWDWACLSSRCCGLWPYFPHTATYGKENANAVTLRLTFHPRNPQLVFSWTYLLGCLLVEAASSSLFARHARASAVPRSCPKIGQRVSCNIAGLKLPFLPHSPPVASLNLVVVQTSVHLCFPLCPRYISVASPSPI